MWVISYLKDGLQDVLGPTESQVSKSFLLTPQFNGWHLSTPLMYVISWKCHQLELSWKLISSSRQGGLTKDLSQVPAWPLLCPLHRQGSSSQCVVVDATVPVPRSTGANHHWRNRQGGFPGGSVVVNLPANVGDSGSVLGSGRSPGEGNWQPTPIFLPGKSHEQRSLAGCTRELQKSRT